MICKNCGQELIENEATCRVCGSPVSETNKIQVTYKNSETELVEPPVIMEAHTFIDEESFAKKVNTLDQSMPRSNNNLDEMWDEPSNKNHFAWIFVIVIIIVLGLVGYFVVYPNIKVDSKKHEKEVMDFTSEKWSSGEFKIDGDFYKLNQPFIKFYDNNWDFVDDEIIELVLDPEEETEEYVISKNSSEKQIKIRIKNPKVKDNAIKDSNVWSIEIDTNLEENELEFELPGKLKNGSSIEEVKTKYGELSNDNVIRDDNKKITTYHYANKNKINLDLIMYDEGGLKAFHYYYS